MGTGSEQKILSEDQQGHKVANKEVTLPQSNIIAILPTNLRVQIHCQCKTDKLRETVLRSGGIEHQTNCPPSINETDLTDLFLYGLMRQNYYLKQFMNN